VGPTTHGKPSACTAISACFALQGNFNHSPIAAAPQLLAHQQGQAALWVGSNATREVLDSQVQLCARRQECLLLLLLLQLLLLLLLLLLQLLWLLPLLLLLRQRRLLLLLLLVLIITHRHRFCSRPQSCGFECCRNCDR
jgi:hypothetical protein